MASAFLGTMLCFGTYGTAMALRSVKRAGKKFNRSVRNAMGDYGVTIAILAVTGVAIAFKRYGDTSVPTLAIPSEFAPTWINPKTGAPRAWLVSPLGINEDFPPWAIFGTIIPARVSPSSGTDQNSRPSSQPERPPRGASCQRITSIY